MRYSDTSHPLSPKISAMCCKLLKMQNFTEILVLKKDLIYIQVAKRGEPFPPGFKKEKSCFCILTLEAGFL